MEAPSPLVMYIDTVVQEKEDFVTEKTADLLSLPLPMLSQYVIALMVNKS